MTDLLLIVLLFSLVPVLLSCAEQHVKDVVRLEKPRVYRALTAFAAQGESERR